MCCTELHAVHAAPQGLFRDLVPDLRSRVTWDPPSPASAPAADGVTATPTASPGGSVYLSAAEGTPGGSANPTAVVAPWSAARGTPGRDGRPHSMVEEHEAEVGP